jgi:hypothetical protein
MADYAVANPPYDPDSNFKQPDTPPQSRGVIAPELLRKSCPSKIRGRRESRVLDAPAASRANEKSTRASHHRSAEIIRPSLRDGLRLMGELSSVSMTF